MRWCRQGLLTSMLTGSLQDAKDRGEIVSVLRAAEWPIYGRVRLLAGVPGNQLPNRFRTQAEHPAPGAGRDHRPARSR
jgi:hypothetical protein